jgi:hypothetical protein
LGKDGGGEGELGDLVTEVADFPALLGDGLAEFGDGLAEPSLLVGDLLRLGTDALVELVFRSAGRFIRAMR